MAGHCLARPAAAEVRAMLHKIKMDNMERGRRLAGAVAQPAPLSFRAGSNQQPYFQHQKWVLFFEVTKQQTSFA